MSPEFSHIDAKGRASMVNVTQKQATHRKAWAKCRVVGLSNSAIELAKEEADNGLLCAAQVAGLTAGKKTYDLIPLCHPIPLIGLQVELELIGDTVEISATSETMSQTGVEMEALTACAASALTIIAGVREADPLVTMEDLTLWEKTGGRSGIWRRDPDTTMQHYDDSSSENQQAR